MACVLLCFDSSPHKDNPREGRIGQFQISMLQGLYKAQPICLLTYCCPCCMNYWVRLKVLDGNLSDYVCCQGYYDNCLCFKSGKCGEKSCPAVCLIMESLCCLGPSMSASRLLVMDKYDLRPDACDNQLIRFSNCINLISCVCEIAAIVNRNFAHLSQMINTVSDVVFYTTLGLMAAQTVNEVKYQTSMEGIMFTQENPVVGYDADSALTGQADRMLAKKKSLL